MWLFTNFGFFSVVQKPGENELTVRSRVRTDLDVLRERYLPTLGPTQAKKGTDYPWRATAGHAALAAGVGQIVMDLHYSNYKNEVAARQGKSRSHRYAKVWDALYDMPEDEAPTKPSALKPHPRHLTRGFPSILPVLSEEQATFAARLIRELESALLRHFGVAHVSELRWHGGSPSPFEVPEYDRFVYGLIALGWVFGDYDLNALLNLDEIHARPEDTIGQMDLPQLQWYLHTLQRADKWASGDWSPILNAVSCGALRLVAQRLENDFRPWNEEPLPWPENLPPNKKVAYGGVLFDDKGRLLLREPRNHYDGYVWTFSKGAPKEDEGPRATALREVDEETGQKARILAPIPGEFPGGTSINRYFLMSLEGRAAALPETCPETSALRWADPREAVALIQQTTNSTGQKRDLAVLEAALTAWRARRG